MVQGSGLSCGNKRRNARLAGCAVWFGSITRSWESTWPIRSRRWCSPIMIGGVAFDWFRSRRRRTQSEPRQQPDDQ